jgi:hypothetical protein
MTHLAKAVLVGVVLSGAACGDGNGPGGLFVTMQEANGSETVFRLGSYSMYIYVHGPDPIHWEELYVHGAYGFFMESGGGSVRHRTVTDIAIESRDGEIVTGHYRMSLDADPRPATDLWGRFALCAETGTTIEPCRNM